MACSIVLGLTFLVLMPACLPEKIEKQASWATIENNQWKPYWKDSIRTQEQRIVLNATVNVDVTSRATAWFNHSQEIGLLVLSTPAITLYGVSLNPFQTESDEWLIRELARQGRGVIENQLRISLDPSTAQLSNRETVTSPSPWDMILTGSRFQADTPQGKGYVTVLRGKHFDDALVLVMVAQSLEAIQSDATIARHLLHPSIEPAISAYAPSPEGLKFLGELEGGFREYAYNDLGDNDPKSKCTIGYGQILFFRLCTPQEKRTIRITEEEARKFFDERTRTDANKILELVSVPLNQNQFDALVSFHYNLGTNILTASDGKLLKLLNERKFEDVPAEMKRYNKSRNPETRKLEYNQGVQNRRCEEADLFAKADYVVTYAYCPRAN